MPGPPGELLTRHTFGHVTKLFLESEFQHKGNKQMERKKEKKNNVNSKQTLAVFSAATD